MPKHKKNKQKNSDYPTIENALSSDDESYRESMDENLDSDGSLDADYFDNLSEDGYTSDDSSKDLYANSVFKVMVKTKEFDYDNPWAPPMQSQHSGTGFAVSFKGQTFLVTNAHVASQNGRMEVRLSDDSEEYKAEAVLIENDCDLAILKVDNPAFMENIRPLPLGEMVKMRQKLTVHGFPMGGEELCITEGKVSRIEVDTYAQAYTNLLQAQVSAEINPGNSGGPAISQGKVVGVAFQGYDGGDGLGYIIPTPVIQHLLTEALDISNYKGFPDLNFNYQELKNETLRTYYGLDAQETGIRVKSIPKLSAAHGILKKDDIILAIDGHTIKNDGTTETEFSKRVNLDYLISRHFIGEPVTFDIIRNKERLQLDVTLKNRAGTTRSVQTKFEEPPTYFFVSGIALCPLTDNAASLDKLIKYMNKEKRKPGEELVYIKTVLACDHNKGFDDFEENLVDKINGKKIQNLRDAVKAVESNPDTHHVIETKNKNIIVVPKLTEAEHKKLLKEFHIHRDRSRDLRHRPVYKPGCPEFDAKLGKPYLPGFSLARSSQATATSHDQEFAKSVKRLAI